MGPKEDLAFVHDAIKRDKLDDAIDKASAIIQRNPDTFKAHILLAFALGKRGRVADAEQTYLAASRLRPNDAQPWQGLVQLYEEQGGSRHRDAVVSLVRIFAEKEDVNKCRDTYDKFLDHVRKTGDTASIVAAYSLVLPEGPLYDLLEGRVMQPALIYERIIPLVEADETKRINTMIGERRTRIGAKLGDVTLEVKRDVYGKSPLENLLRQAIVWTSDDDKRREYEERLVRYCYEKMVVSPPGPGKVEAAKEFHQLCEGMVIIKHPFQLAWETVIDWKDAADVSRWDVTVLREYCVFFPDSDLTKILRGFLTSPISPFPPEPKPQPDQAEGEDAEPPEVPITEEERLVMMAEGITGARSLFGYRLVGEYYQSLEEHESVVELMRKATAVLEKERVKTGYAFQETDTAYSILLATAQVYYQTPRHHREAQALFEKVLERDPSATAALIGVGLIYEEEEDYGQAIHFLDRALARDESNLRVRVEAGWVKALSGDFTAALGQLQDCLTRFDPKAPPNKLRARALYSTGYCAWHLDDSRSARKRRSGAYAYFLDSLKSDLEFAPSYTMLGIYYSEYARDSKRAVRCFQKAVELSASEVQAAEHLARLFANDGDWDRVELVARRVVDSGKVKPPPGSKKRGISWPFAALGVAELNKQEFHKAIVSFQAALRISPSDYHSWVGLGESYHSSGRHMAATKAIVNAQKLEDDPTAVVSPEDTWFTKYLLANVNRELGDYDEAIALYRAVIETRPDEQGVALALLQTMVENAQCSVENGYFGKGVQLTLETIRFAATVRDALQETFNYWKAVGDACAIFTFVQARVAEFPSEDIQKILATDSDHVYSALADMDKVGTAVVFASGGFPMDEEFGVDLTRCLHATLLAHKRAAHVSIQDAHAQPAAYYNLGWAEYRAHSCLPRHLGGKYSRHLRAALAAFKRAIELESGNAEYWNALGVVTSRINATVSQHAFVRSLVLNERSAVAWTNLGTLALLHSDARLANEAYTRAQSADPDYAHAWVGQSFIASLMGDKSEAHALLTHAIDISESSSVAARRHYATAIFDRIVASTPTQSSSSSSSIIPLLGPLFALNQLQALQPQDYPAAHLASLLHERVHDTSRAIAVLENICTLAEADFEATESADALARFALAKTDLARAYLAAGQLDDAIEAADTALGLSSDEADNELSASQRQKARLSANLTTGLARYYGGDVAGSVSSFEDALADTAGDSDAVCLLAQVLWATGGDDNRARAQTLLKAVARENTTHVQSNILLSVMALVANEKNTMAFAQHKLQSLVACSSAPARLSDAEHAHIGAVTRAIALRLGGDKAVRVQAQTDILMAPYRSHGWAALSAAAHQDGNDDGGSVAADMALKVAQRAAAKAGGRRNDGAGPADVDELARTLSCTGRVGDAQNAIVLAPWLGRGWSALGESVAA